MESIDQLKAMRNDALSRLQTNVDYRLLTSLDNLIVDLETMTRNARPTFMVVDDVATAETSAGSHQDIEKAFSEMTSEEEKELLDTDPEEDSDNPAISLN